MKKSEKKRKHEKPESLENRISKGHIILCIFGGACLCAVTFMGIRSRFVPVTSKSHGIKGKTVSVYVDDGTGIYRPNEDGTFPIDGYVLNTEKSGCINGGELSQNPWTKTIRLGIDGSDQCNVYFDIEPPTLLNAIMDKANDASITDYNAGNKGEMFAFDHTATGQVSTWSADELRDYRYIGSNPNNYITFNDETWRIIGVFTVEVEKDDKTTEKQQLVKIIRDESIGNLQWNSTQVNSAYTNEWTGGSLQTMLNSTYINTEGSFTYESETIAKGLSATARSQISNVKFYLGSSSTYEGLGGPDYYAFERGTTTCVTAGNCSGQTRQTSIIQQVGLMYPSDYAYTYANGVDTTCYEDGYNCKMSANGTPSNGWLSNSRNQWTQIPFAGNADSAFNASVIYGVDSEFGIRPTVYLSSDIYITGTGSPEDPYQIVNPIIPYKYKDYISNVYIDSWGNELPGFAGKEITSFDKYGGTLIFDNKTWGIPSDYKIDQVTIYNYNWAELTTYYPRTWFEDYVDNRHARESDYVFKRHMRPDLQYIGGYETLKLNNGSLRFVIIVNKLATSSGT